MSIGLWPLLLCFIRDTHEDRRHAEKDLKLDLYGRTVYILVQVSPTVQYKFKVHRYLTGAENTLK